MFKKSDYVVYKRNVCIVKDIKEKHFNNKDYYVLYPIDDDSLKIDVPVDSNYLRNVISKEEANNLINQIKDVQIITFQDKLSENEYIKLLNSGNLLDLVKIIKTTYLRNEERIKMGKKIGEKDDNYFNMAERILYNELSIALNINFDQVRQYIINKIEKL